MADLLLELLSEEIPARMQARAGADLERLMLARLKEAGLTPDEATHHAGPRRLTFVATGLPTRTEDVTETRRGPKVGAPDKAVQGFLRGAGLASVDEARIEEGNKGAFYVADIHTPGRDAAAVIAEAVPEIVRAFPWPKSMRWGAGALTWVRPLRRVLCTLDGEIVPFEIENAGQGVRSGAVTEGHRFTDHEVFEAATLAAYEAGLAERRVVLRAEDRRARILEGARALCTDGGLALAEDPGLLAETAGLAEWPVPKLGRFDDKFLRLPDEVLAASMKGHQKYFSVRDPETGRLAPRFVAVANVEPEDGGAAMMTGYERVLTARLSDGLFLYDQDRKTTLAEHAEKLSGVTFFEGLGTLADKTDRVAALAREIAPKVGADPDAAERAARLAKADLVAEMVGEFPELQGVMGRYYALEEGIAPDIADAIRDHYKPQGQGDDVPTAPVSVAVALADKLATLAMFWSIGKTPTGSSDPFALRRMALGVIQIVLENGPRLPIEDVLHQYFAENYMISKRPIYTRIADLEINEEDGEITEEARQELASLKRQHPVGWEPEGNTAADAAAHVVNLLTFIHDRLTVYLRDKSHHHDHIAAVLSADRERSDQASNRAPGEARPVGGAARRETKNDDLVLVVRRLEALDALLDTEDGANLTAAYKRAANILRAEAKKGDLPETDVDPQLFAQDEEHALWEALTRAQTVSGAALADEDFQGAMSALASLRAPLDRYFDAVTVNAEDAALRANRLAVLGEIRRVCERVADFGKLEG